MSIHSVDKTTGDITLLSGGTLWSDMPVGSIIPYGGTTAPEGALLCDGAEYLRADYPELFAVIGTSFGTPSENTKFKVPDLREAVPVGAGTSTRSDIATHDAYNVGEFKDDQFQDHAHKTHLKGLQYSEGSLWATAYDQDTDGTTTTGAVSGRVGTTTHGKQLGVTYVIKAKQTALPADFSEQVEEVIEVKADKVSSATNGNFAGLDANGNLTDSGKKASDFVNLTGGNTITGRQVNQANEIVIQCTNLDIDTPPAQSTDGNAYIPFADKDGDAFAVIFANEQTNGAINLRLDTFGQNNPNGTVMINGLDVPALLSKMGGNNLHSWLDIPANISTSGKITRIFTYDENLFIGSQVWNNGTLTKEGFLFFQPTPSQITLLNGVTSSEPGNCNILDFGCFCMVNLAGLVIPSGWIGGTPICEIPRTAIARFNFRVPTSTAAGEIIYIDASTKSLRLTGTCDVPIYTNIMIPTYNA